MMVRCCQLLAGAVVVVVVVVVLFLKEKPEPLRILLFLVCRDVDVASARGKPADASFEEIVDFLRHSWIDQ